MLKFLKNHPRIRVLIIFVLIIGISVGMLSTCSKSNQTYLKSEIKEQKIEATTKNPIQDGSHQKLLEEARKQQIHQAEESSSSYIEDVFATSAAKQPEDNETPSANVQKQMDPVAFYDYKHQQKKLKNGDSGAGGQGLAENLSATQDEAVLDPKTVQKNFEVILKAWNKSPAMNAEFSDLANNSFTGQATLNKNAAVAMFKAGDILIAVIDTSVNSDQPNTPVLAHVVVGPYKHAKLLGSFVREEDKLVVKFNTLSMPTQAASISINAYAIDQNTAQTALASDADHHYLLRYGSLFASSFLQGFGTYFSNAENNRVCYQDSGSGWICQGSEAELTAQKAAYSGLGQIGTALSSSMSKEFDKPPTVTLDQGSAIGILMMQDVKTPSIEM